MRGKLIYKFLLVYVLIALADFILLSTLGSHLVQNFLVSTTSRNLYREATSIANSLGSVSVSSDEDFQNLHEGLSLTAETQNCEIWLIGSDGTIYLNTAEDYDSESTEKIEDFDPIELGNSYYTTGNFFDCFDSSHLTVMVPIASDMNLHGYVAIHEAMTVIYSQREQILGMIHIFSCVLFAMFLLVFFLIWFQILRPLRKIERGTQEFASGNLQYDIDVKSTDEMGHLAASLNMMSDELNKSDEYQRKFIANVSHDFRSPLTSIRGYVAAILDGTIPPESQQKYLGIVLAETERLTKLTNGILQLNNMDRKEFRLEMSDFDINEVIRDTAASFEGRCRERQISIKLLLTGEELYVHADKEKIQQVLYNLIDNAIKFSHDNSTIDLETDLRHDKVYVSVKDHGIGIPRDSINKIWDRFYKTDASRGKERKGNGLGLSIVKEIISDHKQNITIVSTEGVGTEFVFSLDQGQGN